MSDLDFNDIDRDVDRVVELIDLGLITVIKNIGMGTGPINDDPYYHIGCIMQAHERLVEMIKAAELKEKTDA